MRLLLRTSLPRARTLHTTASTSATLGIRAEDPARRWERRAPLSPAAVAKLVSQGVKVLVQPCEKRVFVDSAYEKAGAKVVDSLEAAEVVLGIKEVPIADLLPGKTYAFFSHTHKGQAHNLPLLSAMLDSNSRYIDWELLTDDNGVRTTAFGWLAGVAGMADGLSQFAVKALAKGSATPFLNLPRPYMCSSLSHLRDELRRVGEVIKKRGTPRSLGPIVIVVAGTGRVGAGAKSVLDELPTTWVKADKLRELVESPNPDLSKIYACQLELRDYLSHQDGSPFDRETYRKSPELFFSEFDTKIAPHTTVLLNGGFWQEGCPRILTTAQLAQIQATAAPNRFLSVVDVSCDFGGGLEFVTVPTTIDDPVIQLDATTNSTHRDPSAPHTQISSIEILPSELPLDSSQHFSDSILPYVTSLFADPKSTSATLEARSLRRATIAEGGKLVGEHSKLYELLKASKAGRERKKVVLLGSGLVAGPAVKLLAARTDIDLVIASNVLESATALAAPHPRASAELLDAGDLSSLEKLIAGANVVISLLPAPLHVDVAKLCIAKGTSLITASYVSPAMAELHDSAKAAGIVLLNELGLDPGIDHASAMRLIEEARASGNEITSFVSFCGGLPAPEDSNGVLGYKFSWSPRGVLTAALNDAKFRINSRQISLPGKDLLASHFPDVPIIRGFRFEGVANRDSVSYLEQYGLSQDLPTILRGTLRYPTFSKIVDAFKKLGLLELETLEESPKRWQDVTDVCLRRKGFEVVDEATRAAAISSLIGGDEELLAMVMDTLEQLSLVPTPSNLSAVLPPIPTSPQSPIDLLSNLLAAELKYADDERDAVILHHELCTTSPEKEVELFTSTLVQYGIPGSDSAMASTVGMPIAIGALLCLDGKITSRGIVSPTSPEVWKPLLETLEANGLKLVEKRTKGSRGVLRLLEEQTQTMGL